MPVGEAATVWGREVPAEKVVADAVMAGCVPAYLPVVRAALEAMSDPDFHLHGPATSTGGATPMVIVNGPVCDEMGQPVDVTLDDPRDLR